MEQLRVHLLGSVEVSRGDGAPARFPTQRAKALFALLVLNQDRLFARDVLMGLLWGDHSEQSARKALRTALWRIRSVVEPEGVPSGSHIVIEGQQVGFLGEAPTWVDVREFEEAIRPVDRGGDHPLSVEEARTVADGCTLYRGDLLEGMYQEWCLCERERLKLAFLRALESLVAHHESRGEWRQAIARGLELLRHDPLREHIHRGVMRAHYAMGDRPSAIRQYRTFAKVLRDELDIEPMDETRALYERIRKGDPIGDRATHATLWPPPERAGSLADQVEGALAELYVVASRLERAKAVLERAPGSRAAG